MYTKIQPTKPVPTTKRNKPNQYAQKNGKKGESYGKTSKYVMTRGALQMRRLINESQFR